MRPHYIVFILFFCLKNCEKKARAQLNFRSMGEPTGSKKEQIEKYYFVFLLKLKICLSQKLHRGGSVGCPTTKRSNRRDPLKNNSTNKSKTLIWPSSTRHHGEICRRYSTLFLRLRLRVGIKQKGHRRLLNKIVSLANTFLTVPHFYYH